MQCGTGPADGRHPSRTRGIKVIPLFMAMTLRLTDEETQDLRARAEHEGRSMQDIARQAVRDYLADAQRREILDEVLATELPRYADALRRLGE